ncbi:MAG: 23S rRNA (pseudouridine(1915)-N(3))-methyltransferase RlmH [Candidatus Altiarchaeales archaeon]|nr:23S rRNA (pseudouridine(1915)-N(3))-methyltransferase RlmH [Candidatus Altiarchaeales archaeon]
MIKIVCVGKLKERHYSEACGEYLKRLGRHAKIEIVELKEQSDKDVNVAKRKEAFLIAGKLAGMRDYYKVSLDSRGRQLSSEEFSEILKKPNIAFIIGGPDGLAEEVLKQSDFVLSLSKMTLPHQLARVFLLEQIYRGFTIMKNEKYHK